MQTQKEHTRTCILDTATALFLRRGFAHTTMQHIATGAGTGVSNLYNYFPGGKEQILRTVLAPLLERMDCLIYQHHDPRQALRFVRYMQGQSEELLARQVHDYMHLVQHYRREMEILLFRAQGSALEHYVEEFTRRCTAQVLRFMQAVQADHPHLPLPGSPFTYHLHTVWMFNFFGEVVRHRLPPPEAEQAVRDYIRFEYSGWRALMQSTEPEG